MRKTTIASFAAVIFSCTQTSSSIPDIGEDFIPASISPIEVTDKNSWRFFLKNLPEATGPILDFKGNKIEDQEKHTAIIPFDVGNRDLQQCADALIRLRAEYLFSQKKFSEIGFHFVSGHFYSWDDFCNGRRPVPDGNSIRFVSSAPADRSHQSLRKYLDLVYTYASTISLAKEMKPTDRFEIGTVVIKAGSPGHCFIVTDEATTPSGERLFKLVEGYTPAQSIYVLKNQNDKSLKQWHILRKGVISTASYEFRNYEMRKFE